jgi:hypothetical protein
MRSKVLADAMIERGIPEHIRSGNGPEFVAQDLREWLAAIGAKTLYIEPGSARIGGALPRTRLCQDRRSLANFPTRTAECRSVSRRFVCFQTPSGRRGKSAEVLHQAVDVVSGDLFIVGRHRVGSAGAGFWRGTDNRRFYLVRRAPRSHSVQGWPDVSPVSSNAMA